MLGPYAAVRDMRVVHSLWSCARTTCHIPFAAPQILTGLPASSFPVTLHVLGYRSDEHSTGPPPEIRKTCSVESQLSLIPEPQAKLHPKTMVNLKDKRFILSCHHGNSKRWIHH